MNRRAFTKAAAALPVAIPAAIAITDSLPLKAQTAAAKPVAAKTVSPSALPTGTPLSADALEVLELDRQAELALPRMDVEFLGKVFADDMLFTHGDAWTGKNLPGRVNTKQEWLESIKTSNGLYMRKEANCQRIEMHGDVAVIAGRSSGRLKAETRAPEHDYELWYVRVYQKRSGRWQLLSHKTVRGPQDPTEA